MQRPPDGIPGPLLLIDESLAAVPLKDILKLVGYNVLSSQDVVGAGADDPVILNWLGLQRGVWITADLRAKRQHAENIRDTGVHVIWVYRPKAGLGLRQQALLLLWVLDPILEDLRHARGPREYDAKFSGRRPVWERVG